MIWRRILEILRDYVYFPDPTKEDDTTEIVCRYPQFFATRKLRDHILNHLRSVGILTEEEVTWSQCFMGICSYVNKMTATEHDTESMNRHVEQMVQEAILASGVERVMNEGVEENIFSDSFAKEVDEIKMPFTKFQTLCKLVAKAIRAYGRTNKIQAEHFQKMLEDTIDAYNTHDKLTFTNEVTQILFPLFKIYIAVPCLYVNFSTIIVSTER